MSNFPNCILRTSETNKLASETHIDPVIITAKIASWQATTGRIGDIPSIEEFKEYLNAQQSNSSNFSYTIQDAFGTGRNLQIVKSDSTDKVSSIKNNPESGGSLIAIPKEPISVDQFIDSISGTKTMMLMERNGFTTEKFRGLLLNEADVEEFLIFTEISKLKNSDDNPVRDMRFAWNQMLLLKTDFNNSESENALSEVITEGLVTYAPKGNIPQEYNITKDIHGNWHIYNRQGEEVFKTKDGKSNKDRRLIFGQLAIKDGRAVIVEIGEDKYLVTNNGKITNMQTGRVISTNTSNPLTRLIRSKARKLFNPDAADIVEEEIEKGWKWAKTSNNNFEVSSQGTPLGRKFSAFNAKFSEGTIIDGVDVSGWSIERVYQEVIKKSKKGENPKEESKLNLENYHPLISAGDALTTTDLDPRAKQIIDDYVQNELPISSLPVETLEDFSYYVGYLPLWQKWAEQNPELISHLKKSARGKVLTDKFANTRVSQARALSEILNNLQFNQGRVSRRKPLPESATKWSADKDGTGYRSRTIANASWADITISFAPVTWSAGESLTKTAAENANKGFMFFNPFESLDHSYDGEQIKAELEALGLSTENIKLNIAGNSLKTLNDWSKKRAEKTGTEPHIYTQEEYDKAIQAILQSMLDAGITIKEVRTGGQSGADLAGSNAAYSLGIKNSVLAPKGWGYINAEGETVWGDYNSFVQRFKSWQDAHKEEVNKPWTRDSIAADTKTLYIFTDNTDRNSGSKLIDPESDYAKKYGEDKHYPTQTTAVARGLNNAMPISTQKHWHSKAERERLQITVKDDNWKDSDAEEFERVISEEIDAIIEKWNTGEFEKVKIPQDGFFNSKIADISRKRVPKLYKILQDQYNRLEATIGKDNIEGGITKKAALTLGMSSSYTSSVEQQDGVQKKEKEEGLEINAALDSLNKQSASYVSTTEGISDVEVEMSPTARLSMEFSPQERADREDFLARRFSEIIDGLIDEEKDSVEEELAKTLQEAMTSGNDSSLWKRYNELSRKNRILNDDVKGRRWVMLNASKNGAVGLEAIFEIMKESIEEFRDSEDDPNIVSKYQKLLDNFDILILDACKKLENIEGFQVIPVKTTSTFGTNLTAKTITDNGSEKTAEEKAQEEEIFGDDEAGTNVASGNDGWSFKIRFVDPRTSLSKGVKKVLNRLLDVDYDQNIKLDDLGQPRYRNGEQSHAILLNELSDMIDADDFYNPKEDGYDKYPALNRLSERYPWVTQVMDALDENPELVGSFFSDFNQAFISYWKHDNNGNPMPLNETVAKDAAMQNFIRNYEQARQLDKKYASIYTTGGKINFASVKEAETRVKSILDNEGNLDVTNIDSEVTSLAIALRMMGLEVKDDYLKKLIQTLILDAEEEINDDLYKLLTNMKSILSGIQDKEKFTEDSHLIDTFRDEFGEIARIAGEVTELDNLMSFREGDKTRYSYSAPNYAINIVKKFKSNSRREGFMQKEFADYPWFMQNGKYMSLWLDLLANDDIVRDKLHLKEVISIGSGRYFKEYSEWTDEETRDVLINEYFSQGYNPKSKIQFAYYNFPIFADSPVAMFIRMPKFINTNKESFKEQLIPHYRNLVKQELIRIRQVLDRREKMKELIAEGKISQAAAMEIQNFDKKGSSFCFFPELNTLEVSDEILDTLSGRVDISKLQSNSFKDVVQLLLESHNTSLLNTVIDEAMKEVLNNLFSEFMSGVNLDKQVKNFISKGIIENEKNDAINANNAREKLEEYFWNSTYASSQIIQITTTDLAFYKNGVDFQKRFKEVYAAGNRLNTNTKYGRKIERYITLKDQLITSSNYINIRQSLFQAVKEGRLTKQQAEAIANKFKEVNVADAQAFRSPYAMRAVLDMMGSWNKDMEESLNRFKEGNWNSVDFNIIWQTIKPFLFTNIHKEDGIGGAIRSPHQNKNSEFLVLAAYTVVAAGTKNSAFYTGLGKFFEAHPDDIDLIQFESSVKVGGQGKVDLNYVDKKVLEILNSEKVASELGINNLNKYAESLIINIENATGSEEDIEKTLNKYSNYDKLKIAMDDLLEKGKISQDNYNEIMKDIEPSADEIIEILNDCIKDPETGTFNVAEGKFNKNVVHEASYDDYMIAQPTPEHLIDVDEATAGSQFRNLCPANLPDDFKITLPGSTRELTKQEILRLYRAAITDNLLDSYAEATEIFNNIDNLHDRLIKLINNNPKYGNDLIEALEIVEIVNPITGEKQRVFNLPVDMPSITNQIQELVTSTFKNKVTKQKIKGGNAILVANVGLTRELNVLRDPVTNNVTGVECYLPAWSKKFYKEFIVEKTTINDAGEEVTYEEVDIKAMEKRCPDLLKMIGYRIPTEDKYSMLPLVVKGFLPQQNGSSIMVAADVTVIAGSDFDVDKMFLRIPAFNKSTLEKITYTINETGDIANATKNMSKEQRDNLMIDIEYAILTSKIGSEQMFNPGSFDRPKKMGRIRDITHDVNLLQSWANKHNIQYDDISAIFKSLENASLEELSEFLKDNNAEVNTLTPQAFVYYHGQNMVGNALVGIYANGSSVHTKMQDVNLSIIDSEVFSINGRTIKYLDKIENDLKESIQHNIAEFQNASVDNVKDPVLAKLMQNPDTADTMLFMLRAGISIEEASLLFDNPLLGISENKLLGVFKILSRDYKFKFAPTECTNEVMATSIINSTYCSNFVSLLKEIGSKSMTAEEFNKRIFNLERVINDNPYLKANLGAFVNALYTHMQTYNHCVRLSDSLKQGNAILKADSPNNAIETSIAGAIRQERQVQLFKINAQDKKNFPFEGSNPKDVSDEFIKSGIVTPDMSREEMREVFLNQKLPSLQAFYSLGIELPIYVMSDYFIHGNRDLREGLTFIMNNAFGGNMSTEDIMEFFNGYIKYVMSEVDIFGDNSEGNFDTKRSYYLHTFPQRFMAEIESNPDLKSNPTVKRLSHNLKVGTSNYNAIELKRGGKTTPLMKGVIRRDFNNLLFNKNTVKFAKDLLCYAYYHDGFVYGPNSFGYFFDATYWSRFPSLISTVRTIKEDITAEKVSDYIEQYLANNSHVIKFVKVDDKYKNASQISFREDKDIIANPYTEHGYQDYIRTQFGLFKLDPYTVDDIPVYNKVPIFNSQVPVYNAKSTVSEMSKLYYTQEGEETNVVVRYTNELAEDAPSQDALTQRSNLEHEDLSSQELEEVDQDMFYEEIQNKLNTIGNSTLRSTTGSRLNTLIDEAQDNGDTFDILYPKLRALVDSAIEEDKGECKVPGKTHKYR